MPKRAATSAAPTAGTSKIATRIDPRKFPPIVGLERLDHVHETGCQRNIVEPLDEASAAQGVDAKGVRAALRVDRHLPLQIDRDLGPDPRVQLRPYGRAGFGIEHDRHDAVLEAVVEEDVAEARRD